MSDDITNNREQVLSTLHAVLERDNSLSRCCAVKALGKLNARDTASKRQLSSLLLDPDPDVRADTAAVLGDLKVTGAVEALLNNLQNDPEGEVRILAVTALGKIGVEQAVTPLIQCLQHDGYPQLDFVQDDMEYCASWAVQTQCLNALGEIGDKRATGPIVALLENEDYEELQETGFRVLAQLNNETARAFLLKQIKHGSRLARRRAAVHHCGGRTRFCGGAAVHPDGCLDGDHGEPAGRHPVQIGRAHV